jgi:GNAT superfamily N-acetyltransferase
MPTGAAGVKKPGSGWLARTAHLLYIAAMDFPLTVQMIDKIAFAMEDQKEQYAVDVATGELVAVASLGGEISEDTHVRLPHWGSAEGFHLMESFVTSIDNPVYREQLSRALATGKGVFRAFKDVLKHTKEIEELWFAYKEQRLRGVIISWYNANREARGLAKLPEEVEETDELLMSDFSFLWSAERHVSEVLQMDKDAFFELFPTESPARLEALYAEKREGVPRPGDTRSPLLVAETPGGELAGFIWGTIERTSVHIVQVTVRQTLRGTGLGQTLLRHFLTAMRSRGMERLTTELMGKSLKFADFFQSVGFSPVSEILECGLSDLPY